MNKWMKTLTAALILAGLLVSCSSSSSVKLNEDINIKVIVKKQNHDFWAVVEQGAYAAEKEFGINVDYVGPASEEDISGQIRMVEVAIEEKVDAIVLAAIDYNLLVPVAEKARAAGIPVVIIDSNIKSDKMNGFVGTDNVDAGKVLGESMVAVLGTDIDIVIVSFVKGAASSNEREEGVMKIVNQHENINLIDTLYCNSDEDIAKRLTIEILEKHPEVDAFICLNAYATVGTARGVIEKGMEGEVSIIGFDSTPEEISYLEKDIIELVVVQNPFSMGYLGVKHALDAIKGIPFPRSVNTGAVVITKENMYDPENQKLVFPFVD